MQSIDAPDFTALMAKVWRFYGKTPTGDDIASWFDLFAAFPLAAVAAAFKRHLTDPDHGQYLPKPADLIRHLPGATPDDGHPGPDEAWGLLLRFVQNEAETGIYTEEMRAGWEACTTILKLKDEIGARKCFLETYAKAVTLARQNNQPPRWTVTLGTSPALRAQRLKEAVQAKRLTTDQARALLPGPAPASLDQVAGLLEGPSASEQETKTAERLRALATLLRAASSEAEARRERERQEQQERERDHRAELLQQYSHWIDRQENQA